MNIAFQLEIVPPLPTIYGPADYREFRETLILVDRILLTDGLEVQFIAGDIVHCGLTSPTSRDFEILRKILRCNILRAISELDIGEMSVRLADSMLFQWFTGYHRLGSVETPSKSTLERFSKTFEPSQIRTLTDRCLQSMQKPAISKEFLDRDAEVSVAALFADSTCLKAPVHFPVDWVLLRDGVRTLVKAIGLVRREGLRHRMPEAQSFLRTINGLCIAMSQARRKADAEKQRKATLRLMKRIAKTVSEHGRRYYDLLAAQWESTSWTKPQADCVLKRMDNVLSKLPEATRQAHERIIGERKIASQDKILSLYEPDINTIVRGKAGAEVEFGNGLYLVEQEDGLIVDY